MYDDFGFIDLLSIAKLTEHKLYLLLEHFKTPKAIVSAPHNTIVKIVGQDIAYRILTYQRNDRIKRNHDMLQKMRINIISYNSFEYPRWLKKIAQFPPVLFVRGTIKPEDEVSVGIIGTRGATVYGKNIAERFAGDFAQAGVTVISGMARGIDTMAHQGVIKNKGRTIAVLGCGIDRCYPPENKQLMEAIIQNGAVVSEFNMGTPPLAHNFPKRNRIVSGLSKAILAIEAKEKSGVMNTVNWALDQNKDVFAVPGNIFSRASRGTNRLIKDGAIPVTSVGEILEILGVKYNHQEVMIDKKVLTDTETKIWNKLSFEPTCLDSLSENLKEPTGSLLNALLNLEIKGLVKQLPGMMFIKNI